ncbi:hypothetical protein [Spirosoma endophyticum]|uniref:Sialate O-acetylesterase domain-containing protein n=1 Tax=Spirosoma endophyticum TaxID=662367 RepID=A0A1I1UG60_9BACT|nr:hypothetical protein [Spirosoma endophyticum]SFD67753.1 hypothetical protein SAMN05216167_106190 [Spirosoma endophyticum]
MVLQEPFNRAVYQRDNTGSSFIPIIGDGATSNATITAMFTVIKVGAVQTLEYALPINRTFKANADGSFSGRVVVPGGWYKLTVSDGTTSAVIDRVGAGEVFVLFGHSFMSGGQDKSHQIASTDERVNALVDTIGNGGNRFQQLTQVIGPMQTYPDSWGMFGDKLVKRLGVPVLLYGAAYGGSNIRQSYEVLNNLPRTGLPPGVTDPTSRQPFAPVEFVFDNYVVKTGVRAVLCEHGYNDRGSSADTFVQQFENVFNYIRNHWNRPNLALVLLQEQFVVNPNIQTLTDPVTAQGIKKIIETYPNTFMGPDFNKEYWPAYFKNNDHPFGAAIDQYASDWNDAITADFLSKSTPYLSQSGAAIATAEDNTYSVAGVTLKTFDWAIIAGLGALLLTIFFARQKKGFILMFLILAAFGAGRITGKV